jgi:hypothetical protein
MTYTYGSYHDTCWTSILCFWSTEVSKGTQLESSLSGRKGDSDSQRSSTPFGALLPATILQIAKLMYWEWNLQTINDYVVSMTRNLSRSYQHLTLHISPHSVRIRLITRELEVTEAAKETHQLFLQLIWVDYWVQ